MTWRFFIQWEHSSVPFKGHCCVTLPIFLRRVIHLLTYIICVCNLAGTHFVILANGT